VTESRSAEFDFFEHMAFDPEQLRESRAFYVPMFEGCQEVLDVACGRGEFLEALGRGTGVDIEEAMVLRAREAGLQVALDDAFVYLELHPGSFDGIFSAHFIEHLPYDRAAELIGRSYAALRPGGTLVLVTPNAASIPTLQRHFWWDATHVRMYDPELLKFMLKQAGFQGLEDGVNPRNDPGYPIDVGQLVPPPIDPLGPLELPSHWSNLRTKVGKRHQLELSRQLQLLDHRTQVLYHYLTVMASSLRGLVSALYTPSEVYVRGCKAPVRVAD
jgi:SAM-dependent methyltransferase